MPKYRNSVAECDREFQKCQEKAAGERDQCARLMVLPGGAVLQAAWGCALLGPGILGCVGLVEAIGYSIIGISESLCAHEYYDALAQCSDARINCLAKMQ